MYFGYAENEQQKQAINRRWPTKIRTFISRLSDIPSGEHTIVVNDLKDLGVGIVKLHELSQKHTIYACSQPPVDTLKFYADIERNARSIRSRQAAERKREAGERMGPKPLVERMSKHRRQAILGAVMDPDMNIAKICRTFKLDRRALVKGFGDELAAMGKLK